MMKRSIPPTTLRWLLGSACLGVATLVIDWRLLSAASRRTTTSPRNLELVPSNDRLTAIQGGVRTIRGVDLATPHRSARSTKFSPTNLGTRDVANVTKLWEGSNTIPPWMKRYFAWHEGERTKLTGENWKTRRYLVLRCLATDSKCGGASDRLNALPYLLLLANRTNRLFFITWSRPAPLEEFLVPPIGGLNWTVPDVVDFAPYLIGRGNIFGGGAKNETGIVAHSGNSFWVDTDLFFVEARMAGSPPRGAYNENRDSPYEPSFDEVYRDVWTIMFEPSPGLAREILLAQTTLGLEKGRYVSAHIRAQYVVNATDNKAAVRNAIHCASMLDPGAPIYVGSDSSDVCRYAVEYGRSVLRHPVAAKLGPAPVLHIDRGKSFLSHGDADWDRYPASAYYDTFVDLFLLSGASCVTFGIGGYGRWASKLSADWTCSMQHNVDDCHWTPLSHPKPEGGLVLGSS